jgi:hypothetical protein
MSGGETNDGSGSPWYRDKCGVRLFADGIILLSHSFQYSIVKHNF